MTDPRKDEPADKPFVVNWEATVYGQKLVYAPTEERARAKAAEEILPTREADDRTGPIELIEVYEE